MRLFVFEQFQFAFFSFRSWKEKCATQVVTHTTGMGIITPDIIMDILPGEDAAAMGLITGLTAGKTTNVKADQNQKSDKLSVKYWREYFRHDIEDIFM